MSTKKEEGGLGFRDLKSFNLVMLAKQGWRIVLDPTSLLARVLKAKYFLSTSFWEAGRPSNASSVWKGITDSRFILERGSRGRIRNRENVSVWSDK